MNRGEIIRISFFGIVLILLQVLLFKRLYFGWSGFNYVQFIVYPLLIFIIPFKTPRAALVVIGFILGFLVDMFYDSPGVHTSATVFTAFIRPYVLSLLEPRKGYNVNDAPTAKYLGMNWFLSYASILLFLHLLFYFTVEVFTLYYLGEIWLKTIFSFLFSMILLVIFAFLSETFS